MDAAARRGEQFAGSAPFAAERQRQAVLMLHGLRLAKAKQRYATTRKPCSLAPTHCAADPNGRLSS
ncbi:hypothetical protein [Cupriavidus basilensis]|uniref:hypothetical protein n=1 Tax=Cupriavidus basilensis TaxID=68895 RepID=UPI0023E7F5B9|nr:hypothetical protein [Cupriavidus basilensis]MDF3881960.1 hypothetical protein [Cupriavidus basilensis]